MSYGPVDTSASPHARWTSLPAAAVTFQDGFWLRWQETNRNVGLRHGFDQLHKSGNFNNLRLAAGGGEGEYRTPVFMDSDVYKWLEAVAYELARRPDPELAQMADLAIELVAAAQGDDGYLNSYSDVVEPARRWQDLEHGHELYCAGHLFQAAVAYVRATGDSRLLEISRRFADYIAGVFGPEGITGTPGHPEIEMALVEMYRETGERRYLELAAYFLDQRGHNLLAPRWYGGSAYYQDHVPVREASTMEGHAVRQLYLTSGVADLYLETGEQVLLDAMVRQWRNMVEKKLFITGGVGSQHAGEAFGEPYELPNERCYCETCAQIASIMWNWRLLLATGECRYADLLERTLFNGFLSGVSLDGRRYFYVNPLLSHGADPLLGRKHVVRPEWHGCACCPPNVMRTLASLTHYVASADAGGVQIHQYAPATLNATLTGGRTVGLTMETDYPWQGAVRLTVTESDGAPWTLRLRVPDWCRGATLQVNGETLPGATGGRYVAVERSWQPGDAIELALTMTPYFMVGHPRVDTTRDSVAIQRGPLVYCLEEADQDIEADLLDVVVDTGAPLTDAWRGDLLGGVMTVHAGGYKPANRGRSGGLFRPLASVPESDGKPIALTALPYYAWANRGAGKMRVWIPRWRDA